MANAATYKDKRSSFEIAQKFYKKIVDAHFEAHRFAAASWDPRKISISCMITIEGAERPWVYFSSGAKTARRIDLLSQVHASECPPLAALPPLTNEEVECTIVRNWPQPVIAQLIEFFKTKAEMAIFFYQVCSRDLFEFTRQPIVFNVFCDSLTLRLRALV